MIELPTPTRKGERRKVACGKINVCRNITPLKWMSRHRRDITPFFADMVGHIHKKPAMSSLLYGAKIYNAIR